MNELVTSGVASIVALSHHPFGNAYFATTACGGAPYNSSKRHCWAAACVESASPAADCFADQSTLVVQHGETEKDVNRLQACAHTLTAYDSDWTKRLWPFILCTETLYETKGVDSAQECSKTAGLSYAALEACYVGAAGDAAVVREAKATIDHPGTPYVAVNGKETSVDQVIAEVCAAYTGPKPSGCNGRFAAAAEPRASTTCL